MAVGVRETAYLAHAPNFIDLQAAGTALANDAS
jgi:hypothetical protein